MADQPEIAVDPSAIPDELTARDQWLLWDASADAPRRPHWRGDFSVSWIDPDDWHSFDDALAAVESEPSWGLGYVLANGNDEYMRGLYGGLDLDDCVTARGRPKDWLPALDPFNERAYMEYSPSGDGIHVILPGFDVPDWWSNVHFSHEAHEGVEAYDSKFFTFTGDPIEASAETCGEVPQDAIEDWLAAAAAEITGEDPRERHTPNPSEQPETSKEPEKSKDELKDVNTTTEMDDLVAAVDHLSPSDLPLRSSYVDDENTEVESWNPSYRQSKSGRSLKRWKDTGLFIDMAEGDVNRGFTPFGALDLFAAEQGIIRRPWNRLQGEDWVDAVDAAREAGAPIPEYVGTPGDVPQDAIQDETDVDDKRIWQVWADARANGSFDEESIVPDAAIRHIAREYTHYPDEYIPDDDDEDISWRAVNLALDWLEYHWGPQELGIDLDDDDAPAVTARRKRSADATSVFTWDAVREIYSESNQDGRYAAVSLLRERYEFLTPEDTEALHIYDEELGIYDRSATFEVGRILDRNLQQHYSQHEKQEIIGRLKERKVERDELEAGEFDGNYLCVANGVLDLDERELLDHDPTWKFTTRLPQEYDPDAEAAAIRKFLSDITRREADRQTLLEMVGNCLLDNYDYESFLILFGEGANGKSTWYEVVREFLGDENVESMTLQQITDNRFAASNLVGKWANIGEDLPAKKIHDLGSLKDLTGGGETWVEPKGKDGFSFRNRAKMMFAANEPPVLGERTKAVARRLLPIRLPYQFTTKDDEHKDAQKEGLLNELTTEEELSGLLNLALDGLDRLRAAGDFSLPESHQERLEYYEQFSDHIKMFAVNSLTNESGAREKKSDIYNAYTNFCAEQGHEPVAQSTFWTQLRKTTLDISVVRPQSDGSRKRMVDNLTFTDHGTQYAPHYDDTTEADQISALAPGDDRIKIDVLVSDVESDTPPQIAEKATVEDTSGTIVATVWDDADAPALIEGECYRLKNVEVTEHEGQREVLVSRQSGVEEIAPGVGNAPTTDPGDNAQLDTAADGGANAHEGPPADATNTAAHAQRARSVLEDMGGGSVMELVAQLGEQHDMEPETAKRAIEYARTEMNPALIAGPDGNLRPN